MTGFFLSKKTFGRGTKFTKIIGCITYAQERILLEDLYVLTTILDLLVGGVKLYYSSIFSIKAIFQKSSLKFIHSSHPRKENRKHYVCNDRDETRETKSAEI